MVAVPSNADETSKREELNPTIWRGDRRPPNHPSYNSAFPDPAPPPSAEELRKRAAAFREKWKRRG